MKRIPLTHGQFAVVDDEDFERLSKSRWYASKHRGEKSWRAMRDSLRDSSGKSRPISMAREVMNAADGELVDHIHHKTLDNRKSELRICTKSQNTMNSRLKSNNSSGFKGVTRDKRNHRWKAYIGLDGKSRYIGNFHDARDAAAAYDAKAVELFGEFALTNRALGLL